METIAKHAQGLVYSLLCLMPSLYQKASLNALLGLFLEAQGHALPQHTQLKSASSLSRFLNRYAWSTRRVIRATRQAILQQIAQHRPRRGMPLRVLIDLTSLEKCGKFLHLSTPTDDPEHPDPWVRMLNGKRGCIWLCFIWKSLSGESPGVFEFGEARGIPVRLNLPVSY